MQHTTYTTHLIFLQSLRTMSACWERMDDPKFNVPPALPTTRYRTYPFLVDPKTPNTKGSLRSQEQHVPRGPHRRNSSIEISPALGIGTPRCFKTINWSEGKPIVRAPWPRDFVSCDRAGIRSPRAAAPAVPAVTIESIVKECAYQTTSRKAGQEYALPVPDPPKPTSTMEESADSARLRLQRYHSQPGCWQKCSFEWDKLQLRNSPRMAAERITL